MDTFTSRAGIAKVAMASVGLAALRTLVLVAYPAEYRSSGVMTFTVTRNGSVYEKDLGPKTPTLAKTGPGTTQG
jgi:hypothetical protein